MARPGARRLGPGLGLKYEIVLRAGPGLDIIFAGRDGSGPHNSICGPDRAWASNHVFGPGLGLDFRSVQGSSVLVAAFSAVFNGSRYTPKSIFSVYDRPYCYTLPYVGPIRVFRGAHVKHVHPGK